MRTLKEKFLILRKLKYGEADLILHALSPQGAKYSFIARSALKSKKRFGGGILEPSHFLVLTFKENSEVGGLHVLEEASLINDFKGIRQSYDHLELSLHVLECISKVAQEGDFTSEHLFNLTGNMLKAIEKSQSLHLLRLHFHLKFLLQQGVIQPEPWMSVFLKTPLSQSEEIKTSGSEILEHSDSIEAMVRHYIQNASI
ncbi:MAG: DNA repair protein RecO [Bdellovibrionia bacterium]